MSPTNTRRPTAERRAVEGTARPSSGGRRSALSPSVRPEHTGERPSYFSVQHRRMLPGWAFCCDVDCLEVRAGRGIVAALEVGEVDGLPTEQRLRAIGKCKGLQLGAVRQIGQALSIPHFFVLISRTLPCVAILDLATDRVLELAEADFWAMIEGL